MRLELDIQYAEEVMGRPLPSNEDIERWVRAGLGEREEGAQLVVRIVGIEEGTRLNATYRKRKGPTNVLTFCFEQPELLTPPLLGDVVICAPVVENEAQEQHKDLYAHWAHMVVHGVLHLLGYDHEHDCDAIVMEERENTLLGALGYGDPYSGDVTLNSTVATGAP